MNPKPTVLLVRKVDSHHNRPALGKGVLDCVDVFKWSLSPLQHLENHLRRSESAGPADLLVSLKEDDMVRELEFLDRDHDTRYGLERIAA